MACKRGLLSLLVCGLVTSRRFDELFEPSWALDHVSFEGEQLNLKLDNFSGVGFASKSKYMSKYMFGKTTVQIKLVGGSWTKAHELHGISEGIGIASIRILPESRLSEACLQSICTIIE